jgi:peptide/nickel transport system ATP-binding protein
MMAGLRDREGVSLLYITHDLASARYVADRIVVMYAGHLVEEGPTETVLSDPKHPYTQLLLSAVADPREKEAELSADTGEPPRVINPSEGCRFRWRCPYAIEKCAENTPRPEPIGSARVACHVALAEGAAPRASKPTGTASMS